MTHRIKTIKTQAAKKRYKSGDWILAETRVQYGEQSHCLYSFWTSEKVAY